MYCLCGNATDPIWRVLASSDGISSWTPLKPQHSNPNPLANQLWGIDFLTPPRLQYVSIIGFLFCFFFLCEPGSGFYSSNQNQQPSLKKKNKKKHTHTHTHTQGIEGWLMGVTGQAADRYCQRSLTLRFFVFVDKCKVFIARLKMLWLRYFIHCMVYLQQWVATQIDRC